MMFVITKNNSKYLHVSDTKTIQNAFMYTSVVVKQEVWKTPQKKSFIYLDCTHAQKQTQSISRAQQSSMLVWFRTWCVLIYFLHNSVFTARLQVVLWQEADSQRCSRAWVSNLWRGKCVVNCYWRSQEGRYVSQRRYIV